MVLLSCVLFHTLRFILNFFIQRAKTVSSLAYYALWSQMADKAGKVEAAERDGPSSSYAFLCEPRRPAGLVVAAPAAALFLAPGEAAFFRVPPASATAAAAPAFRLLPFVPESLPPPVVAAATASEGASGVTVSGNSSRKARRRTYVFFLGGGGRHHRNEKSTREHKRT